MTHSLIWLLLSCTVVHAQNAQPTEYQIKSAFLLNFARFVEWPAKAYSDASSPLVIGILGNNPFHEDLAHTVTNKTIDGHPIIIKEFRTAAEAVNCHLLFISGSEKDRLPGIFAALKGSSVLTVSETEKFTENGGMINLVLEGTKVRFQINNDAAAKAGLKVSSKLISLAIRGGG